MSDCTKWIYPIAFFITKFTIVNIFWKYIYTLLFLVSHAFCLHYLTWPKCIIHGRGPWQGGIPQKKQQLTGLATQWQYIAALRLTLNFAQLKKKAVKFVSSQLYEYESLSLWPKETSCKPNYERENHFVDFIIQFNSYVFYLNFVVFAILCNWTLYVYTLGYLGLHRFTPK